MMNLFSINGLLNIIKSLDLFRIFYLQKAKGRFKRTSCKKSSLLLILQFDQNLSVGYPTKKILLLHGNFYSLCYTLKKIRILQIKFENVVELLSKVKQKAAV